MKTDIKTSISRNFSKAAENYNSTATMQRDIASELVRYAKPYTLPGMVALDMGCGTGFVASALKQNIVQLDIAPGMCRKASELSPSICADMESLPFADNVFDTVFSSSSLQWTDMTKSLSQAQRVLKEEGTFAFSTFGYYTLADIRNCFGLAKMESGMRPFHTRAEVEAYINYCGMKVELFETENIRVEHRTLSDLLWYMKDIGAAAASGGSSTPLTKEKLIMLEHIYKKNFNPDKVVANWEILYFICKRS